MVEKDMQVLFGKYIKSHSPKQAEIYELKICKGTALPFDHVQPHQVEALLNATEKGLYHKINDQPWGYNKKFRFTMKKPFDCFYLTGVKAFIVIWFYRPKQKKVFIKIPIRTFIIESVKSKRKSLTEERALAIGEKILL